MHAAKAGQALVKRRGGSRAGVQAVQIEFLVGGMHTIIGQAESYQQRVDA
jgi:hypothetical protein